MTSHRPILASGEIYHIYNRTIGKVSVFSDIRNLYKFFQIVNYYRYSQTLKLSKFNTLPHFTQLTYMQKILKQSPLIEIYVFSFMPNHFHFLLKQMQNRGISKFLSNIQNSFAKYFNLKNDRDGGLFKNSFKAKRITNNEEFIHVSRYIHLNHVTSKIIEFDQLLTYQWTSLPYYLNYQNPQGSWNPEGYSLVNTKPILDYFKTPEKYLRFLKNNVEYQIKLKEIKDLLID